LRTLMVLVCAPASWAYGGAVNRRMVECCCATAECVVKICSPE